MNAGRLIPTGYAALPLVVVGAINRQEAEALPILRFRFFAICNGGQASYLAACATPQLAIAAIRKWFVVAWANASAEV